jgi:3-hydroxybutyryl-CoA dehydrogenase
MKSIENICIAGTGYMGWQIGLQCASSGFPIEFFDVSEEALKGALRSITQELDRRVGEKQITVGEKETILSNINSTEDMSEAASNVDLVIEAVPERLEIKRDVFKQLDQVCLSHTILATNSSSIRISRIEDATQRPDKVLNMHFYGSPWRSLIVELMRGTATSDGTIERVKQFAIAIGMIPIIVQKESTGFVFNRVWRAIKRETLHLVDDGVASFEDVDRAWMCIYGASIGPFGMMDRVGLDVVRDIEMVYYGESGDERDAPPRLLIDKVERGELGVKTGKGFYTYPDPVFQNLSWLRARR